MLGPFLLPDDDWKSTDLVDLFEIAGIRPTGPARIAEDAPCGQGQSGRRRLPRRPRE
jgi:hypothetical protein